MPSLLIGGIAASASHLSLAALATTGQSMPMLTLAICVENFAGGFAGTALIAFMSSLRRRSTPPPNMRCSAHSTPCRAKFSADFPALPSPLSAIRPFSSPHPALASRSPRFAWRSGAAQARTPRPEALQEDPAAAT